MSFDLDPIQRLLTQIRDTILHARRTASNNLAKLRVLTCFEIGRLIVEHEQQGVARAEYGKQTLKHLAEKLSQEFGRGVSLTNLKLMRQFYLIKKNQIGQTVSDFLSSAQTNEIARISAVPFTLI